MTDADALLLVIDVQNDFMPGGSLAAARRRLGQAGVRTIGSDRI